MRIWISATCRSKSRTINDWPSSLIQCILVSTRLRRWYPLQRRHRVWPLSREPRRTHQGKMCWGRTPLETMIDGKAIWREQFVKWTWPERRRQKNGQLSDHIWTTTNYWISTIFLIDLLFLLYFLNILLIFDWAVIILDRISFGRLWPNKSKPLSPFRCP